MTPSTAHHPAVSTRSDAQLLGQAFFQAGERLEVRQDILQRILGISASSMKRRRQDRTIRPASGEGERALMFLRAYRSRGGVLGAENTAAMRQWLHGEHPVLGGSPVELLTTIEGMGRVCTYLDSFRGH
jgi:uncharacterized protein (DUF2384 family)